MRAAPWIRVAFLPMLARCEFRGQWHVYFWYQWIAGPLQTFSLQVSHYRVHTARVGPFLRCRMFIGDVDANMLPSQHTL